MDRDALVKSWSEVWEDGLWHAAWSRVLAGLTPRQAAWKPDADRHSIAQIARHITFWREYTVQSLAGEAPGDDEVNRRSWEDPAAAGPEWDRTKRQFEESYRKVMKAMKDSKNDPDQIRHLLVHDAYHIGQIMYLRALQGLKPIV